MTATLLRLSAVGLACALASSANAQIARKDLSATTALTIAQVALETCTKQGYRVSATIVGRTGEIIVQVRGDDAPPHTLENSMRKAYTSRTTRAPSGELVKRLKDNPQLALVNLSNIIAAQGALP